MTIGQIATAALLAWALAFALVIARIKGMGIYAIYQALMAFFQGPALALILAGLMWKRANGKGAFIGFVGSFLFPPSSPPPERCRPPVPADPREVRQNPRCEACIPE